MIRTDWADQWCRMDDEGGPVTVSYGRRESFVLADDMSDFFGTQRSIDGDFSQCHSMHKCVTALFAAPVSHCITPCKIMASTMLSTDNICTGIA